MSTLFWDICILFKVSYQCLACPPYLAFAVGVQCGQKFQFKVDTLENGVCLLKDGEYARMRTSCYPVELQSLVKTLSVTISFRNVLISLSLEETMQLL